MTRHLAIGDIHGCFHALRTLIEFAQVEPQDLVITLGDYVDRGSNSYAVLDWVIDRFERGGLIPLRGNHELMMLGSQTNADLRKSWLRGGGDATLRSYAPFEGEPGSVIDVPERHWTFLECDLRAFYELPEYFFVHANAYPGFPLDEQPDFVLYWEGIDDPPRHESGKIMVCGHSPQRHGIPFNNGNAIGIDTWACGDGWLTAFDIEAEKFFQAKESGETRELSLEETTLP